MGIGVTQSSTLEILQREYNCRQVRKVLPPPRQQSLCCADAPKSSETNECRVMSERPI
jgi:hypothetical protein